jgi:hypothetical protein
MSLLNKKKDPTTFPLEKQSGFIFQGQVESSKP